MNLTPGTNTRAYRALPTHTITPQSHTPVSYSSLDIRANTHRPIEQVTVIDVTPTTKLLPRDTHFIPRDIVTHLLTFVLCTIGLLGFMSYTLEFATSVVTEQRVNK